MSICVIDTSVLTNVLDIPGVNQEREMVIQELKRQVEAGTNLLLPAAVIFETGNHIAYLRDGQQRRHYATRFVGEVKSAFNGDSPWAPTAVPGRKELLTWLDGFPERAMEGKSLADHSIIEVWHRQCELNPKRRVYIWSLDGDLAGYDRVV